MTVRTMCDDEQQRPRRPSPPPTGRREREPPSPTLLAHSLPSTATLNALPTLSRAPSQLHIASTIANEQQSLPTAEQKTTSRFTQGELIFLPGTIAPSSKPPNKIPDAIKDIAGAVKTVLNLDSEPELQDVSLHVHASAPIYQTWTPYFYEDDPTKPGSLLIRLRDHQHSRAPGYVVSGQAFRMQNPGDEEKLVEFYSQTYRVECESEECFMVCGRGEDEPEPRHTETKRGKVIIASWPLKPR